MRSSRSIEEVHHYELMKGIEKMIQTIGMILYWIIHVLLSPLFTLFVPVCSFDGKDKWVVITGCDSGFGSMLTEQLFSDKYRVIATCLSESSVKKLAEKFPGDRVFPMLCDSMKPDQLDALFEKVKQLTPVVHALVNNAGIVCFILLFF